jgi:ferric hydroxamate transport system substrate-binding protein
MRKIITVLLSIITAAFLITASNGVGVTFAQTPSSMNCTTAAAATTANNTTTETAIAIPMLQSSNSSTTNNQTRVISHDMGETTITGTPQRAVTMGHIPIEVLFEIGKEPVGATGWEVGSRQNPEDIGWEMYYSGISKEWLNVTNVGSVDEPNFEVIASLEPDLIVYEDRGSLHFYDDLSEIAPTLHYSTYSQLGNMTELEHMEWETMEIADALNRHDVGVEIVERMNANFEEEASKLEAAGVSGEKFIFLQIFPEENPPFSVFVPDSRQSETLEAIGLVPALSANEDTDQTGRIYIGLEQMAALDAPDLHVIYLYYGDDPGPALEDNPVWGQLSFVQEGRLHAIGIPAPASTINIWGGPLTAIQFVDKVVEVMTNSSSSSSNN